jgi:hypothetical protein
LKEPPTGSPAHIPVPSSVACELCHVATNFTTFSGTVMRHAAVAGQACDSCHEYRMAWYGEPNLWTRPSPSHHAGQDCGGSECHTARDKTAVRPSAARTVVTARVRVPTLSRSMGITASRAALIGPASMQPSASNGFNHALVDSQSCASCHNGVVASGKPPGHLSTRGDCGSCHTTLSWTRVASVDHMQLVGRCASCHDGRTAVGKPITHLATRSDCGVCHTSNAWLPARFDHAAGVITSCRSCHDGVHAIGIPPEHPATSAQCSDCHGTLAWQPARVNHATLTERCANCHNNVVASGLPPTHIAVSADCSACHSYPDWRAVGSQRDRQAVPATRGPRVLRP